MQGLEKLHRWTLLNQDASWPLSIVNVEDNFQALSKQPSAGITSYSRARLSLLYMEAAADIEPANQVSQSPALLATIKELELRAGTKRQKEKRQAPSTA